MQYQQQPQVALLAVKKISEVLRRLEVDEDSIRSLGFSFWKSHRERMRRIEDKRDELIDELQELLDEVIV